MAILFATVGAAWSAAPAGELELRNLPRDTGDVAAAALHIAVGNLQALSALPLLGLCSGGLYSLATLAWNGYALGHLLPGVLQAGPAATLFVLAYAPAEFLSMVMGCVAVQHTWWSAGRWLVNGTRVDLGWPAPVSHF